MGLFNKTAKICTKYITCTTPTSPKGIKWRKFLININSIHKSELSLLWMVFADSIDQDQMNKTCSVIFDKHHQLPDDNV